MQPEASHDSHLDDQFPVTHWTLVMSAGCKTEGTTQREALARLCEIYWLPLYCFVRRQGHNPDDAKDLTQGFFLHLLKKNGLSVANPAKGSFRSFLLQSLKHYVINEWHMANAQKRDPGYPILSFDAARAETHFGLEPVDNTSPETIYERDCAWALVEKAIVRLRGRYEASGRLPLYEHLKPTLMGEQTALSYKELAERLKTTEQALRSETYRMRKELHRFVVELLAPVASNPKEITAEIKGLFEALSR